MVETVKQVKWSL